jgi:hypothetical protein
MESSIAATRYVPVDTIGWRVVPLALPARSDAGYTLDDSRAAMADVKRTEIERIRAANRVAFYERLDRPLDASLLRIGPAWIVHLPGECMVDFQLYAQQLRPHGFVAVAAYGDLAPGYICTAKAYREGGYEPSASNVGPESEAALKSALNELLDADTRRNAP